MESTYPLAPLTIPSSLYFACGWLEVITTGASAFRKSFDSNPPVCVSDSLLGTSGGHSKFLHLSDHSVCHNNY